MSVSVYRRNNCRLCGGQNLELILKLAPTPLADAYVPAKYLNQVQSTYPLDLYLCHGCGFSQLPDVVHPESVYRDYIYETTSSLGLVEHFQRYADAIMHRINPPQGAIVVDIGSNDGTLLKFFQNRGMRVLGIDPAIAIAHKATEAGIETLPDFFTAELAQTIKKKYGLATIITANNLFANVDDLAQLTQSISDLLAPNGVFIFESFYLLDLVANMVFDFIYHEHLSYFSVKPLKAFFERQNMELIEVERVPTKGGSLRCTVQLAGGPRPVSPSVPEILALEASLGMDHPEIFKKFASRIDNAKNQLINLLRDLKAQGKSIAGYGASATTTTFIYHFDLSEFMSFIADDYISKQNLFSPGYHIPVLSPQAIYEKKVDYVVILAWRYAEPIIKKHQAFLEQGGLFIIPLPHLKIV